MSTKFNLLFLKVPITTKTPPGLAGYSDESIKHGGTKEHRFSCKFYALKMNIRGLVGLLSG